MKVLVTGATGFVGRALIPFLVSRPDTEITILLRESYGQIDRRPLPPELAAVRQKIQVVYADLRSYQLTRRAVQAAAPDRVIHLAAAGVTDPFLNLDSALRHNLTGTLNLTRACFERQAGVQQFITARTPGELSSMNVYAASKAAAWNFCTMYGRTQGWPIHGAMIFQAYGPGQPPSILIPAAVAAAKAGQDFPMTAGSQQRDWVYIDDIVGGFGAMLQANLAPGESVELGRGKATSVLEVVQHIYKMIGWGGQPLPGCLPERPGEVQLQVADAAKTARQIDWQATFSLRDGLARLLAQEGM